MGWPQCGQLAAADDSERRHSGQATSGIDGKK
jgi:hypothetical protein